MSGLRRPGAWAVATGTAYPNRNPNGNGQRDATADARTDARHPHRVSTELPPHATTLYSQFSSAL